MALDPTPSVPTGRAPRRARQRRRGVMAALALTALVAAAIAVPIASGGDGPPGGHAGSRTATGDSGTGQTSTTAAGGTTGTTGSTDPVAQTLPPAPAGFAQQLTGLYNGINKAVTTLGLPAGGTGGASGATLPTDAGFAHLVGQLNSDNLSILYAGTLKQSGWTSLQPTYTQLDQDVAGMSGAASAQVKAALKDASTSGSGAGTTAKANVKATTPSTPAGGAAAHATTHATSRAGTAELDAATPVPFPPPSPSGSFPAPPPAFNPSSPVAPANVPATCPMPPPGADLGTAAIYGAQISADVLNETVDGLPAEVGVIVAGVPALIPDPARIVLEVAATAATLLEDQFNYMNNSNNDCGYVTTIDYVENIDNTTVNTYNLMTLMESTLDSVESSVNTISGQVHTVQQTLDDQLTLTIQQDLAAPAGATPNLALELPASVGGNLDSTPIGVQKIVTAVVGQIGAIGEAENPAATQYLAMANAALSAGNDVQAYDDFHTAYLEAVQ